ncbi:hypothetical protein CAL26_08680 [Bordetella genomosp. 9]|uniref:Uncharacterized protein n=1 Tax=Bordetella genomosp. 9 TaxID=1416803 RepID=A0A261REQ8_9BORD|nr:hypothetical protein [Bordetella genomosp. 9]OZI23509.1 hypothetical protein CAL26_08680 [Bordetella genomosp. 9]
MSVNDLAGVALLATAAAWPVHARHGQDAQLVEHAGHDSPASAPTAVSSAPEWPDKDIVEQMLRRETRAALAAQAHRRGRAAGATSTFPSAGSTASTASSVDAPAEPQADRLDLAAIYGVGKRLDVEVVVNGHRLRYRHGRKWPEESPDGDGAYALRAIQGQCVLLDRDGGKRRVCLTRAD